MDRGAGLRRHASSVFWLGLAEAAVRGGNVVLQFLLARALGRQQYGVFAYAFSLAMIVVPAGGIGLLEAFVRKGASERRGIVPALSEFFPLRAASAAATLGLLVAIAAAQRTDSAAVLVVGIFALFRALTAFLAAAFRAAEVIWKEFALRTGEAAGLLAVVFASMRFRPDLVSLSATLAGAAAVFFVLTLAVFRRMFPGFRWKWPGAWLSSTVRAAPLGLPAFAGVLLLRTDVVLIRRLTGDAAATADYAAAATLVLGVGLVPVTIAAALFPALSRRSLTGPARDRSVAPRFSSGSDRASLCSCGWEDRRWSVWPTGRNSIRPRASSPRSRRFSSFSRRPFSRPRSLLAQRGRPALRSRSRPAAPEGRSRFSAPSGTALAHSGELHGRSSDHVRGGACLSLPASRPLRFFVTYW